MSYHTNKYKSHGSFDISILYFARLQNNPNKIKILCVYLNFIIFLVNFN